MRFSPGDITADVLPGAWDAVAWEAAALWHEWPADDDTDLSDFDFSDSDSDSDSDLTESTPAEGDLSWRDADTAPAIDELVATATRARSAIADQYRLVADILHDAEADPAPWAGPDPTSFPGWIDRRGRSASAVRRDRREMAVRSAAADIAVRLHLSEAAVHATARTAGVLRERCPRVWMLFQSGLVTEANARACADAASTLPDTARDAWTAFDAQAAEPCQTLTSGAFRARARVLCEKLHPQSIDERHAQAHARRTVWRQDLPDGMATLGVHMSATTAHEAFRRIDAMARHLRAHDDERRTLAQLRADVAADLLVHGLGTEDSAQAATVRPIVAITIPALTLLGHGDQPATLEGYGPIPLREARRLAGTATSWIRVLTRPVTGTVLDVDRTVYRVPKAMRRWLTVHMPTCTFPGCGRPARDCDIDHDVDWQFGGTTSTANTSPKCRHHHRVKHETRWACDNVGDGVQWTSPTGWKSTNDPPPF